jgi:hypothetical protein
MDKKKIKEKLHQYIDNLEDEAALQMLHEAAVEYETAEKRDIVDDLTPEQFKRLEESIKQLDNGQWKSHDEVMKLSRTWLRK